MEHGHNRCQYAPIKAVGQGGFWGCRETALPSKNAGNCKEKKETGVDAVGPCNPRKAIAGAQF
jgi:hypothetical protein